MEGPIRIRRESTKTIVRVRVCQALSISARPSLMTFKETMILYYDFKLRISLIKQSSRSPKTPSKHHELLISAGIACFFFFV